MSPEFSKAGLEGDGEMGSKTQRVWFRLTEQEARRLEELVAATGRTQSDVLRTLVRTAQLVPQLQPVAGPLVHEPPA